MKYIFSNIPHTGGALLKKWLSQKEITFLKKDDPILVGNAYLGFGDVELFPYLSKYQSCKSFAMIRDPFEQVIDQYIHLKGLELEEVICDPDFQNVQNMHIGAIDNLDYPLLYDRLSESISYVSQILNIRKGTIMKLKKDYSKYKGFRELIYEMNPEDFTLWHLASAKFEENIQQLIKSQ